MSGRSIFLLVIIWSSLNVKFTLSYRLSDNVDHSVNQMMADAVVNAARRESDKHSCSSNVMEESLLAGPRTVTTPRHPIERKKWGVDKEQMTEYWFNSRIHTFGNTGILGGLHAALAPMATKMIDDLAYKGVDARVHLAKEICQGIQKEGARILDLCW